MLDYTIWDLKNEFYLEEIAHLWFDIDPNEDKLKIPDAVKLKIKAMDGVLEEAVANGDLPAEHYGMNGTSWGYSRKTVIAWAERIGQKPLFLFPEERKKSSSEITKNDAENFIKNLKVNYESDLEVKIQTPKKEAKLYNHKLLGFRDSGGEGWKMFIEILQTKGYSFNFGRAYTYIRKEKAQRVKNYDAVRKLIEFINKKLITFFRKEYHTEFPKNFKVYEPFPELKGVLRFKFQGGNLMENKEDKPPDDISDQEETKKLFGDLRYDPKEFHNSHQE